MHGPATNAKYSAPGAVSTLVWCTDRAPGDIAVGECVEDMGARRAPPGKSMTVKREPVGDPATAIMHRRETLTWAESGRGERARQAFVLIDAAMVKVGNRAERDARERRDFRVERDSHYRNARPDTEWGAAQRVTCRSYQGVDVELTRDTRRERGYAFSVAGFRAGTAFARFLRPSREEERREIETL